MFVKIMKWKVARSSDKESNNESIIYDECMEQILLEAKSAELIPMDGDEISEPTIRLLLDVGKPERQEFNFPQDPVSTMTEVYYMNDQGKTIESFKY